MAPSLKNGLDRPAISRLAHNIEAAWPAFDTDAFVTAATRGLSRLELKERVGHVADQLANFLPEDYPEALEVIRGASKTWDRGDDSDPLRGFAAWPLFHFIEQYGIDDFDRSMAALRCITHLFSAEFAVRAFIERYPERALEDLMRWTQDESEHVRRLVSEGMRPRLPWATRIAALIDDPTPGLALLEKLKSDASLYVRRSVANHLNDIAKDHPDRVIDTCTKWSKNASDERRWVIERATRTLVKAGHPRVWALLGFTENPNVEISPIRLESKHIVLGDDLVFNAKLTHTGQTRQRLAVDYAMHFVKATGKTRPKVFKLKVLELEPGEIYEFSARRSFRPISTRKYYPGLHAIEILINGEIHAREEFELRGRT